MARPSGPGWIRRHRGVVLAVTTVFVGALVLGGVVFALRWSDRVPGPASIDDAVEDYRSATTTTAPATTDPVTDSGAPSEGVYRYAGDGSERLSLLDTTQPQGPELPATVTVLDDGCWSFEIAYNEHHSQSWTFCDRDGALVEIGGATTQEFDFVAFDVHDLTEFTCDPPGLRVDPEANPGNEWRQECTGVSEVQGTTTVSAGTNRFVGIDELTIDGTTVAAYHYRMERTISGDQSGTTTEDAWFALDSMLPVREERSSEVVSPAPAPLDEVTYTETGWWQLGELDPLR